MKLSREALQGTWVVAGSEIDHLAPGGEIYHFTPEWLIMEFPPTKPRHRYRYELTDEGFIYGKGELNIPVTAWLEGGFLIFRPSHGMETWSVRTQHPATPAS